ncbi:helix-turn-helix domain-containing protein [Megamonas funiformis]|jgi:transcriptional regulator with XRE-family HTH domain|uniref:helix-turn-helix domain-containing protein n=1 Tax=Megamonas funiformis TaxID=437897 RepID=UPI000E51739D|nr:helix-turn-helix transcriptional regulator [Megamonas funiformis]RGW46206.1 XRE family transcriptional regulator [Megamonas funiformis]
MNITGERLRQLRENKQLSQGEVAKLIGVSRPAYVLYETGRSKPLRKIKELCALFNVSADYILGNDVEPINKKEMDKKKPADLEKFLNQSEIMFDGEVMKLSEEDRQEIKNALEFIFYKAKKKNKRKK